MSIIECKNLNIGFSDKILVKDINFKLNTGDYLCIVGENGSGKSTLIKTILGLHKPLKGKIFLKKDKSFVAGYVPQVTDFQKDFPATVKEIIMSGFISKMGWRPFYKKEEKESALNIMKSLNIIDFQNKCYKELSGGQQQKVMLARAMCASSEFLVLDEPTNGLDARSIVSLHKTISRLNKEKSLSVIMISHDLSQVIDDVTHVLVLKKAGYFFGTREEFLNSENASLFLNGDKL